MGNRDNTINLDSAAVAVRFDSDTEAAGRPVSLHVTPLTDGELASAFSLEMSLNEAVDIANNLLDAVEFAKRYHRAGGDL